MRREIVPAILERDRQLLQRNQISQEQLIRRKKTNQRTQVKKSALIIVDGMGIAGDEKGNAASRRTMPFLHSLMDEFGFAKLEASGEAIGLDAGQAGNSEVGHLTIGAGRVLPTTLSRIRTAFANGDWLAASAWRSIPSIKRIHVVGLLSDAGVHAHWTTIVKTARLASIRGAEKIYLHLFLDGVDSAADTAPALLSELRTAIASIPNAQIATISGRAWACDRSGDRSVSEHCVQGLFGELDGALFTDEALQAHLASGKTEASFPFHYADIGGVINAGEPVILTQHRADRLRQLAQAMNARTAIHSLIELDGVLPNARVFFPTQKLNQGLVHSLAEHGIHATRVAESCKFPHVTFFMNGMRDDVHGQAVEIPSIAERLIPEQPEMGLADLQKHIGQLLANSDERALIINLPNLDQVGHTGNLALAEKAAQYVDNALRALVAQSKELGWNLVITADHGNADRMLDHDGKPVGSHSTNPVPLLVIGSGAHKHALKSNTGTLANVAATFLATLGLTAPSFMDESLIDV